mgnify:CR=1 FL=1
MRKHIPNAITCCNLICGCCAAGAGFHGHFMWAFVMILAGATFDFFDGMVARLLHVSSPIGKELDSLADCVTFGVAPSAMLFQVLGRGMEGTSWGAEPWAMVIPYLAFLIAAFSALRLAKFNLDERQTSSFIGLPTPINALFWCSMIVGGWASYCAVPYLLLLVATSCFMLVCELPLFALKFKSWGWAGNGVRYIFIAGCVALIALFGWSAFAPITLWYVILSIVGRD